MAALQAAAAVGVALELLLGKHLLSELLPEEGVISADAGSVVPALILLLLLAAFVTVAAVVQSEHQRVISEVVSRYVHDRLLDAAVAADLQAYETPSFFDRLERAEVGGQSRPWQMTMGLLIVVGAGLTVVGIIIALVAIEPLVLPLVLASSIPFWFATLRNSRDGHAFAHRMTPVDRERRYLSSVLTGRGFAKEVRMFGLSDFLREIHNALYERRIEGLKELAHRRLRRSLIATLATAALGAAALVILVSLVLSRQTDVAGAVTAGLGIQQLGVRLRTMYASVGSLYEGALFLDDFESFVQLPLPQAEPAISAPAPHGFSRIVLDRVSFAYPGMDAYALKDISFEIRAGEIVALVGENGSGKTTLAKLLSHLYQPTSGRILWDGTDAALYRPSDLRQFVTGIFQDFARYDLRARDNIAVGRPDKFFDLDSIVAAARQAGADEILAQLPEGYETRLGRQFEGGRELSVGQWQRVALARAFFREAPFIILDEPTAALDARAEHELFEAVRHLMCGRTVLLISHRFSSVRFADRIFLLKRGEIVEEGTHDELIRGHGVYAELFTLQVASCGERGT